MSKQNEQWDEIAGALLKAETAFLFPHVLMDGDSLGSSVALCHVLRSMGKTAWILIEENIPEYLEFLDQGFCTYDGELILNPDVCIAVDCSDMGRIEQRRDVFLQGKTTICIDHHITSEGFGALNYVDSNSASTAELIYDLIQVMGIAGTPEAAEALYTGIMTDTGNFQYSNTTSKTLRIAADLYDWGMDHQKVIVAVYQSMRPEKVKLNSLALSGMELFGDGKAVMAAVTREMLEETGASLEETEGIVEVLRNIKGVEISVFLKEWGPELTRVGFRAKAAGNVAQIAQQFGGGGHIKAAGCTIAKSVSECKKLLQAAVENHLKELI